MFRPKKKYHTYIYTFPRTTCRADRTTNRNKEHVYSRARNTFKWPRKTTTIDAKTLQSLQNKLTKLMGGKKKTQSLSKPMSLQLPWYFRDIEQRICSDPRAYQYSSPAASQPKHGNSISRKPTTVGDSYAPKGENPQNIFAKSKIALTRAKICSLCPFGPAHLQSTTINSIL